MAGRSAYKLPLPAGRNQLMQRVPMGAAIKCFAADPTPFWREAGLNDFVNTLTPGAMIDVVFDNSPPEGTPGALYGLIEGDAAWEWGPRPAAETATEACGSMDGAISAAARAVQDVLA